MSERTQFIIYTQDWLSDFWLARGTRVAGNNARIHVGSVLIARRVTERWQGDGRRHEPVRPPHKSRRVHDDPGRERGARSSAGSGRAGSIPSMEIGDHARGLRTSPALPSVPSNPTGRRASWPSLRGREPLAGSTGSRRSRSVWQINGLQTFAGFLRLKRASKSSKLRIILTSLCVRIGIYFTRHAVRLDAYAKISIPPCICSSCSANTFELDDNTELHS
jgi:hypothetical protein